MYLCRTGIPCVAVAGETLLPKQQEKSAVAWLFENISCSNLTFLVKNMLLVHKGAMEMLLLLATLLRGNILASYLEHLLSRTLFVTGLPHHHGNYLAMATSLLCKNI